MLSCCCCCCRNNNIGTHRWYVQWHNIIIIIIIIINNNNNNDKNNNNRPDFSDGSDMNALCRTRDKRHVVTADDHGNINLFNCPCVVEDAPAHKSVFLM